MSGKRRRDACDGQQTSPPPISPKEVNVVVVAAVKSRVTVTKGRLGGIPVELMLDSGSSVSLVQGNILSQAQDIVHIKAVRPLQLVTASGEQLPIMGHIRALVNLGELELLHEFVVVESLVAPVILGVDFLQGNALVLDFSQSPVVVRHTKPGPLSQSQASLSINQVLPLYEAEQRTQARACVITTLEEPGTDVVDDCAVPNYQEPKSSLYPMVERYQDLFRTTPGVT